MDSPKVLWIPNYIATSIYLLLNNSGRCLMSFYLLTFYFKQNSYQCTITARWYKSDKDYNTNKFSTGFHGWSLLFRVRSEEARVRPVRVPALICERRWRQLGSISRTNYCSNCIQNLGHFTLSIKWFRLSGRLLHNLLVEIGTWSEGSRFPDCHVGQDLGVELDVATVQGFLHMPCVIAELGCSGINT